MREEVQLDGFWSRQKRGFPGGSAVKNLAGNAGDAGLIPGLGRCPGEGNGTPFQYSCLGNPMGRGVWWATVHVVARVGHNLVTKQQQSPSVKSPGGAQSSARLSRKRQRMRWLDGITHSMGTGLGGLRGLVCCGSWGRKESDATELKQ